MKVFLNAKRCGACGTAMPTTDGEILRLVDEARSKASAGRIDEAEMALESLLTTPNTPAEVRLELAAVKLTQVRRLRADIRFDSLMAKKRAECLETLGPLLQDSVHGASAQKLRHDLLSDAGPKKGSGELSEAAIVAIIVAVVVGIIAVAVSNL